MECKFIHSNWFITSQLTFFRIFSTRGTLNELGLPFLLSLLSFLSFFPHSFLQQLLPVLSSDPIPYSDVISISELQEFDTVYLTALWTWCKKPDVVNYSDRSSRYGRAGGSIYEFVVTGHNPLGRIKSPLHLERSLGASVLTCERGAGLVPALECCRFQAQRPANSRYLRHFVWEWPQGQVW